MLREKLNKNNKNVESLSLEVINKKIKKTLFSGISDTYGYLVQF